MDEQFGDLAGNVPPLPVQVLDRILASLTDGRGLEFRDTRLGLLWIFWMVRLDTPCSRC